MKWAEVTPDQWKQLQRRFDDGLPAAPIAERPTISLYEAEIWSAFWQMRHATPSGGMGNLNGISFNEIDAWIRCRQEKFDSHMDRNAFIDVIHSLDKEYLKLVNDKQSAKSKNTKVKGAK